MEKTMLMGNTCFKKKSNSDKKGCFLNDIKNHNFIKNRLDGTKLKSEKII